ncbi:MAG: glycosyltransferase family 2 protein [Chthoniobacterales bacterium]
MPFTSATILLPVMDETESLRKSVRIVEEECAPDVCEYILSVCDRTTPESVAICRSYVDSAPEKFVLHFQKLPFVGGALREAFDLARGSHVLMMASDLETEPATVKELIAEAKKTPDAIITASRWIKGGGFEGYNKVKLVSNYVFQKIFSVLYGVKLTDMTYGFRIFPAHVVKSIRWEELRHPFFFETLIKPLRLGVPVREIATPWKARVEGESQNTFLRNFAYFAPGFKTRFAQKEKLLK